MIIGIEGEVLYKEPNILHILTNSGLIYEVNISLNSSNRIQSNQVRLLITQIIREDANLLFGFTDRDEKKMFDSLIGINGIGPKVALATCSTFTPATFAKIIESKDKKMLKKVSGIGEKAAGRILVELTNFNVESEDNSKEGEEHLKASMALESLGFKKEEIKDALLNESGSNLKSWV